VSDQPDLGARLARARQRVDQAPDDWNAWEALYVAWAQTGEVAAAWRALQECISRAPLHASIHPRAVRFLLGTRDYEAALDRAETLLADHPADVDLLMLGLEAALAVDAWDKAER
jgi:uncharacterized protein HemY